MAPILRDDLSARLVHLTRGETSEAAATFQKIVSERMLRGGTGGIEGGYRCVCFSEAPIGKLAYLLADPSVTEMRYKPFGVMVDKAWLFGKGGRPVIYEPKADFDLLPESHRFRHVEYEPPDGKDVTWEREWRVPVDELPLEPAAVTLVVPTRAWERYFQARHAASVRGEVMSAVWMGMGEFANVRSFEWHFAVLEDIGVDIPSVEPPPR